jgi:hypothetical protein
MGYSPNMSRSPEKSIRQQLQEAQANVQRQIEILQSGPLVNYRGGVPRTDAMLADLKATLKEIENSLVSLGKDDA